MKITIELDTSNEDDRHTADTYQMSAETRAACKTLLQHINKRLKYCQLNTAAEELEFIRYLVLDELDGWEP